MTNDRRNVWIVLKTISSHSCLPESAEHPPRVAPGPLLPKTLISRSNVWASEALKRPQRTHNLFFQAVQCRLTEEKIPAAENPLNCRQAGRICRFLPVDRSAAVLISIVSSDKPSFSTTRNELANDNRIMMLHRYPDRTHQNLTSKSSLSRSSAIIAYPPLS